mgnify:CR=1 FL=1
MELLPDGEPLLVLPRAVAVLSAAGRQRLADVILVQCRAQVIRATDLVVGGGGANVLVEDADDDAVHLLHVPKLELVVVLLLNLVRQPAKAFFVSSAFHYLTLQIV